MSKRSGEGRRTITTTRGRCVRRARQAAVRGGPLKSAAQQDWQTLHRGRDGLVRQRTAPVNQVRGLLAEQGSVLAAGLGRFRQLGPQVLEHPAVALSGVLREVVAEAEAWGQALAARIKRVAQQRAAASPAAAAVARLRAGPGFGPLVPTALVGAVGDGRTFGAGREWAAGLGLGPRQHTTGGKPRLYGITKRGDKRRRALLIDGARAVVRHATRKADSLSRWIRAVQARRGTTVATVALATKLVRSARGGARPGGTVCAGPGRRLRPAP